MTSQKPITLRDVALLAGVSQSAVSRTFTPGASVAATTRIRVQDAARMLGYRPNAIARTLTTRRSRMIGVVVSYMQSQFYPLVIEKLSQALRHHGYQVLLFISDRNESGRPDLDDKLQDVMQYQVDGLVLLSVTVSLALALECQSTGVPVVLLNCEAPVNGVSSVASDNVEGGRLAARALIDAGCRRIAYIAGVENALTQIERQRGFLQTLGQSGVELFGRAVGNYSYDGARRAARELCTVHTRPDGIFVANDHMAIAVMDTLRSELGLSVPQDVAIVGFDNVPQSAWSAYGLTTIEQDAGQLVRTTVEVLLQGIDSQSLPTREASVPVRLIRRQTV